MIVLITALNLAGASTVARAERVVVAIKLAILLLFVAVGLAGVSAARLAPAQWSSPVSVIAGGMIIFLAYEGFELIANAAEDVTDPGRTLTRAYYICVVFVIALYVRSRSSRWDRCRWPASSMPATTPWPRPPGRLWARPGSR